MQASILGEKLLPSTYNYLLHRSFYREHAAFYELTKIQSCPRIFVHIPRHQCSCPFDLPQQFRVSIHIKFLTDFFTATNVISTQKPQLSHGLGEVPHTLVELYFMFSESQKDGFP
jgi:hypothetical protein